MIFRENIIAFLAENKQLFFNKFYLVKLGLFGSYAKNSFTDCSDIDIIVEFKPNTKDLYLIKKEFKSLLKDQFGKEIDICREKYIKPYFMDHILRSANYI